MKLTFRTSQMSQKQTFASARKSDIRRGAEGPPAEPMGGRVVRTGLITPPQRSIMSWTLAARSPITKGLVRTSMPGASRPLPTAAFSA